MDSELQQLQKAKDLAMDNSPEQMLPKVLETANSMLLNTWKSSDGSKPDVDHKLTNFFNTLLLDTMNHVKISSHEKPLIASQYLNTLNLCFENAFDDMHCLQLTILTLTRIYPMLFDLVAKTSDDSTWNLLTMLKKKILNKWKSMTITNLPLNLNLDNKKIGIKLAMVKFISQIIITHSTDITNSSINISLVPDNQPLINKTKLESEAKILLDVIINYLVEEPMMVSSLFIGIINCLSFVMKQRTQTVIKILNGLLKFNIDAKYQNDEITALNYKLCKRFVERCYKNFIQFGIKSHLIKNSSSNANMTQLYTKLSKISQTLYVIGEETKSKGILNFDEESVMKKISASERDKIIQYRTKKRQQSAASAPPIVPLRAQSQPQQQNSPIINSNNTSTQGSGTPPLTEDQIKALLSLQEYSKGKTQTTTFVNTSPKAIDNTYGSLFTLMDQEGSGSKQDVSKIPNDFLIKLSTEAFYKADTKRLITALSIAASRYTDLMNNNDPSIGDKRKREDGEAENDEVKKTKKDSEDNVDKENNKPYFFEPKPMDDNTKLKLTERIMKKLFDIKDNKISPKINSVSNSTKNPLEQIKLINWSNDESWYHILIRLATRGTRSNLTMSNMIREELLKYVMMDINDNNRVAIIIEWMNEEWYGDMLFETREDTESQYNHWSLRLLDELIPFLENKHRKLFIRLMSELPRLTTDHINKVKPILIDPSRSTLGFQTLKFLIMFRLPVKSMIKPLLEAIVQEDPSVEPQCKPILDKFYK
ncbi:pre-tRNA-processing protein Pta1p [Monosporozyma unispora]|nr:hypothetical protein C6P44_002803 [Kazachstania unispora]